MIKVLQICSSSSLGGGEVFTYNLVSQIHKDFDFVVVCPQGYFFDKYEGDEVKVLLVKKPYSSLLSTWQIIKYIKSERPDIVHCQGTRAALWCRLAYFFVKVRPKLIYTLHGFHLIRKKGFKKSVMLKIEKYLNRLVDILVTVSRGDANHVRELNLIQSNKIKTIRNGVKFDFGSNLESEVPVIDKTKFSILFVGRLHVPKDLNTPIKALSNLVKKYNDIEFIIAGDGPLRTEIEDLVKSLNLEEYVKMLGYRNDVSTLLYQSDVLLFSSAWEGLPLTLLEAGLCKKASIASRVDGVVEVIEDGKNGLLFDYQDISELEQKIELLYHNKDLKEELGANAYEVVRQDFSFEKMCEKYKKLYEDIASK